MSYPLGILNVCAKSSSGSNGPSVQLWGKKILVVLTVYVFLTCYYNGNTRKENSDIFINGHCLIGLQ